MFPPVSAQEHYVFELTESTFERINKWASSLHVPDDLSEHKLIRKQDSRESAHTPFFVFPVTALYAEPCKSTVINISSQRILFRNIHSYDFRVAVLKHLLTQNRSSSARASKFRENWFGFLPPATSEVLRNIPCVRSLPIAFHRHRLQRVRSSFKNV